MTAARSILAGAGAGVSGATLAVALMMIDAGRWDLAAGLAVSAALVAWSVWLLVAWDRETRR